MEKRYETLDINNKLIWNFRDIGHTMHRISEGKGGQKRILIILRETGGMTRKELTRRLAIARAFVADPRILIPDEATSNVDTRTERAIQRAMHQVMEGRTSIIIAHRLFTIRAADLIVVTDQGRIVEQGNHESLLARKGKYYDLYMTRFAGFAT